MDRHVGRCSLAYIGGCGQTWTEVGVVIRGQTFW